MQNEVRHGCIGHGVSASSLELGEPTRTHAFCWDEMANNLLSPMQEGDAEVFSVQDWCLTESITLAVRCAFSESDIVVLTTVSLSFVLLKFSIGRDTAVIAWPNAHKNPCMSSFASMPCVRASFGYCGRSNARP